MLGMALSPFYDYSCPLFFVYTCTLFLIIYTHGLYFILISFREAHLIILIAFHVKYLFSVFLEYISLRDIFSSHCSFFRRSSIYSFALFFHLLIRVVNWLIDSVYISDGDV